MRPATGTITDTSFAPLPGVMIEATSAKMQGIRVEVSGRDGLYRVLAVPPGKYRIRASLEGFETVERSVTVALDARATLDLRMTIVARESVTVSSEVPLIDVTSATSGTNYNHTVITKLPAARNYSDVVRSNPGVGTDRGETQGARSRCPSMAPRRSRTSGSSTASTRPTSSMDSRGRPSTTEGADAR